ncbi:amino acid adenylation domain-containing protein [Streptomyces sp. NPDC052052]|uniref:amino acid adenylation domain-containing protein n=1 Tax=Streptomyces sp. NPDC052052 TaxID=3154756 RepID=UPI003449F1AD
MNTASTGHPRDRLRLLTAAGLVMSRAQRLPRFTIGPDGEAAQPLVLPWRVTLDAAARAVAERFPATDTAPGDRWQSGRTGLLLRAGRPEGFSVTVPEDLRHLDADLVTGRVTALLDRWDETSASSLGQVPLWGERDRAVIGSGSGTTLPAPRRTVAQAFADRTAEEPDGECLVDDHGVMSCAELAFLAANYTTGLRRAGIGPSDVVAVDLPRDRQLIAACLGIWGAGAAFMPVDTGHPAERVAGQLAAAGARAIVGDPDGRLAGSLPHVGPVPGSPHTPSHHSAPDDLAYVLCTSGSTGKPKAVGVSHGALAGCVDAFTGILGAGRRVAHLTAATFDISLLEFAYPLVTDGVLLMVDNVRRKEPAAAIQWLTDQRADVIQATPSMWSLLVDCLRGDWSHAVLLCGGEALAPGLAARLTSTGAQLWNCYGPTEATIWCTTHRVEPGTDPAVPIGTPLPGTTAHVLTGPDLEPVPVGELGELCVGGRQLALGYLGRDDLTAQAFVDHPVHGRIYRTGDICSWQRDGTLRIHGRTDDQVKVRGHRVELPEVDAVAESCPGVRRAAGVVVQQGDDLALLCCLELQPGASPDVSDIRAFMAARLPSAWVPTQFAVLAELPRMSSGKIDRRSLRALAQTLEPLAS